MCIDWALLVKSCHSGGGFSKQFDQTEAAYQVKATANYLATAKGLPPASSYPAKGRGTPDVSALGEGYQVVVGGHIEAVGGTSASSPAFAGLVSLLNDAREKKGMKPMGFLNPFLYQNEVRPLSHTALYLKPEPPPHTHSSISIP